MAKELETFEAKRVLPMVVLGVLLFFVPAITYVTLQTTASMFKVTHLVKLLIYRPGLFHVLKQPSTGLVKRIWSKVAVKHWIVIA